MQKINSKKYPNCARGIKYAEDVISGEVVACEFVIGAAKRFFRMLENEDKSKYYFDFDAAEKFLRLAQKFEHVIGTWDRKFIVFEPWQCFCWMNIMGFKNTVTGFRLFRTAHIEVARGNGKSAMASIAVLYLLALDNPNGNQISTVATKKDQARIVLDSARAMARKNSSFLKHTGIKVLAHTITHLKSNSIVRALSSDHKGLDGLNDVLAVCDELHAMSRDTYEVVSSGMSKRKDSLILCITTAGSDVDSVGHSQSFYAKKICTGEIEDDTFFAIVYTLDKNDDWADENVWIKANPNIDVSVDRVTLKAKVEKAFVTPADIPNIKIKHLDMWIAEANAFYDPNKWDECADPSLKIEDFKKMPSKMGVDLASHLDLTSYVTIFKKEGIYYIFDKTFVPETTVKESKNDLYENSIISGHLIATPGDAINYEKIGDAIEATIKDFRVLECAYDPWNAIEMAQRLEKKTEMVKFPMNVANLSEPMKKLDTLMREKKIRHNGSPLVRWCLGNVVAKEDHNGNVFPRKSHNKLKIDPVIAILMALGLWLQDEGTTSVYEQRGIRSL